MDEITMEQWEMGIYEDAVETWGREAQLMKAAEELSELAAAINRLLCAKSPGTGAGRRSCRRCRKSVLTWRSCSTSST